MEKRKTERYPRTILMTTDTAGGVWTYALNLTRALDRFDIWVHLATMGALPDEKQRQEAALIPNLQLHAGDFKLEWMDDPWQEVDQAGQWLMQLQRELKPDLVHLNNFCHGDLPWKVPVLMVAHSCVYSWWESVIGGTPPAGQYREYFTRVQRGLHAADRLVAPSRDLLLTLGKIYGEVPQRAVIPNGCDPAGLPPVPKENRIMSIGRLWDSAKNIESLNSVAHELAWPVVIAGDNFQPGSSHTAAFANVKHIGKLSGPEVKQWLNRSAIYALPARYEPFGLSILEAAYAGCTLVLGDIPSLRENWIGAAYFVEPGNLEALKYTLNTLIERPDLRKKYGEKATIRAQAFSSLRMATSYLDHYQQLLDAHLISQGTFTGKPYSG
jgi:glycogen synthase